MSLNTKLLPVGIDIAIDEIQRDVYSYLTNTAGWTNYESYPRIYKNQKGDSVVPEFYTTDKEYIEVLFDDKVSCSSFFVIDDNATSTDNEGERVFTQRVSIVFQGLLDEIYPSITHRADAEFWNDIFNAIDSTQYDVLAWHTGMDNVYTDFDLRGLLDGKVQLDDLSNFHYVRFDLEVVYSYDCKINLL